ncbi:TVP38/TMEM64 family protein [Gramella jeungdoensis]|uniref:TVP38/TMEM64 family membrane protein n=1 Tax=Gramella jeungdoensis TaxID=708091 RepID=A0ABT0Z545_9FLAO|nr:TVP38/TMEM64 family protein [Gramella jeungdoensis]MCM8570846.1 TVP38/TMEM64 family protein [Gramella jeungdoensis]
MMDSTVLEKKNVNQSKLPLYISLALVTLIVLAYFLFPSAQNFLDEAWGVLTSGDNNRIQQWFKDFGWMAPVLLIIAMVAQMFLIIIPTIALMVVSILAYGPIWGSLIVFVAVFTASSVGYFIGRYFGPVIVEKIIGHKSEKKVADFLEDYGFWAVFITRLNPFLSNDAISFVGGILKMGYRKFISATIIGIAPLTIFIAILGKSTQGLKTGLLWGSIISLILFGAYIYWDKRKRKN